MEDQTAQTAETEQPAPQPSQPRLTWQASEYIQHDKNPMWFVGLFVIAALLGGFFIWTHYWTSLAVVVVMVVVVLRFAVKPPRTLNYALETSGLRIEDKLYGYDQFKSFSVLPDLSWHSIELEPVQRFMPRLTIYFDDQHLDQIVAILADYLPRFDRQPDVIDRISRYLQF